MPEHWMQLGSFLFSAIGISLSGVLAPGPMTAAVVSAGALRQHAGALAALGHAVVEFPLMVLVMWGAAGIFEIPGVAIGIGLLGGAVLLVMGGQTLAGLRKKVDSSNPPPQRHPFLAGILLSGANPYFLLWWATIGLALTTKAAGLGVFAFAVFALVHWLCDLVWLEVLSLASFRGSRIMGERAQRIVPAVCGVALLFFGGKFIVSAVGELLSGSGSPAG